MKKQEIKHILMTIRNPENEGKVNELLGKLDMLNQETIQKMLEQIGDSEENVRSFLEKKLQKEKHSPEHLPLNDMFTYGIAGNCIHLHLPGDLHQMISEQGISKTIDMVNLQLLDAIERIRALKDSEFYRFQDKDSIYMISPILRGKEMRFLEGMDFTTTLYRKKELKDERFLDEHPEAKLARHIFGENKDVGSAIISIERICSKEWQEKRKQKIAEWKSKEMTLQKEKEM